MGEWDALKRGTGSGWKELEREGVEILDAVNANSAKIPTASYTPENIVYDSVTEKYWWVIQDNNANIRLAWAITPDGTYTVESNPVIDETYGLDAPCLVKFDSYWYIYYKRNDTQQIEAQRSTTINSGYSATGITNPILSKGAGGTWDDALVGEPYVFKEGSTYYLFYMGMNTLTNPTAYEKTGYATSTSPTSGFTKYGSNPVIGDTADDWNPGHCRAADPHIFKKNNTFYIGVAGNVAATINQPWRTGFYKTTDFITFTEVEGNPILDLGGSGQWDVNAAWRGAVSEFSGTYHFSYGGRDASSIARCGLTELIFDTGWKALIGGVYEDFTTYTEVDIAADRIQKTANHIDHSAYRNENTYLYKDYGAAHFGNFTHKIKARNTNTNVGGMGYVYMLANAVGNFYTLGAAGNTLIALGIYDTTDVYLYEYYGSTQYFDGNTTGFSVNAWIYPKIVKSGTSLTAYLYSDSGYSTLVDTLSLTLHANHTFRYLYGCNTRNDGGANQKTNDIENFDLG